jgi:hypothetical protein
LSVPFFISFISLSTFFPAEGEYFRVDLFFEGDFFADGRLYILSCIDNHSVGQRAAESFQFARALLRSLAAVFRNQHWNPIHHRIDPSAACAHDSSFLNMQCAEAGRTGQSIDPLS